MRCPKCDSAMECIGYGADTVARCTACRGLFFRPEDLAGMRRAWLSEFVDSGNPAKGRAYNAIEDIECPRCGVPMDKVSDRHQTHIWYETCPECGGVYFDAGEFSDWKKLEPMDWVRDLLSRRRPR